MHVDFHLQLEPGELIFDHIEPAVLGASSAELSEILCKGRGDIPLGSRAAWMEIQRSNVECRKYLDQVKYGQLPGKKDTSKANLNKMRKSCTVEKGLIVCKTFDRILMKERSRVFVPGEFLRSILTVIHVRLDHISAFQLENVFNRYFIGILTNSTCQQIVEECSLCVSLQKFPKELEQFDPKLEPEHPGSHMNADVMQRAGQKILMNTDLFSGYTTACFLENEQKEEMVRGLLHLITPIRHSPEVIVRVDSAPALKSLKKSGHADLSENGLKLVLGEDMNKNSNCSIDKKMQELQMEIKRLCPTETKISLSTLSKAVTNLNSRIRNQGLTSSQITFSRDTVSGENLNLSDHRLLEDKLGKRKLNNTQSAKSKAPKGKDQTKPNLLPGDIAYVKNQGSKHESREPFLVTGNLDNKVRVQKLLHSHSTSSRGPALSSEVKTVDSRFLFKQKKTTNSPSSPLAEVITDKSRYVIPQRRSCINKKVPTWASKQSADCTTDNEEPPDTHAQDDDDEDDESEHETSESENLDDDTSDNSGDGELAAQSDESQPENEGASEHGGSWSEDLTENDSQGELREEEIHFEEQVADDDENLTEVMEPQQNVSIQDVSDDVSDQSKTDGATGEDRLLFLNDHQSLYLPEILCQHGIPRIYDRVSFFHDQFNQWTPVVLISNAVRGYKSYYNIAYDDGTEDGVYLNPDLRWTFIEASCCADCAGRPADIGQLDGICLPRSLTPTPETTPEKEECLRLEPGDYLESSEENSDSPVPVLDKSFTGSPEWDSYGTHLERPLLYDQPLEYITQLDRPANLSLVLPLTSTPIPHSRPRVSHQRRLLPLEADPVDDADDLSDDQHPPRFLSKLNPFRKRSGK